MYKNKWIEKNPVTRPGIKLEAIRKIVMHYTANPEMTAHEHYEWLNQERKRYASAHFFVDRNETLCVVPTDEVAYHANDRARFVNGELYRGTKALLPDANYLSLSIEMCVDRNIEIASEIEMRALELAVFLCAKHQLEATDIIRHFDISGKFCPAPWVNNPERFEQFRSKAVQKLKQIRQEKN
ncbi:N-acetylmuramoyl-L-alanine amidase [Listeria floridensis FSL S10-1187]|uniref:N-acetylmuramoyl-L-alanine amidase n=2 Tax=Listeria floridensis TaxID=1494962 RepID=A0ABP3AV83_9LIST|nr:N-acetylmuramoyl-L-alanine amidase [Listeria floridensis FSL S10-1187]